MKQNKCILFYFFLFITITTIAQNKSFDSIVSALQKEHLFFEKTFIHTNKSKYDKEDTVWFKAYVSSSDNKPSLKTTLLYVSLFSAKGDLIETQNIFIHEGIGVGQFALHDGLDSGDYYIQARTNFMKNFGDENAFVSKISIGNIVKKNIGKSEILYDVQLFPEGGYLLENAANVIAIKALLNGKSYAFQAKIIDSKNNEIVYFNNPYKGMSKCEFYYNESEKYQAIININDTILKIDVPLPKSKGVTLKIKENSSFLDLEMQTNQQTLQNLNDAYFVLFHQNNKIVNYADIVLKDTSKIVLKIDKKDFYNGVNTVTIFKNSTPILERKFFVYKDVEKIDVNIEKLTKEKDSVVFKLNTLASDGTANLSASVLSNSEQLDVNTNIEAAFLLTPYLKGYIEKPSYYFNDKNKDRFMHLDLLLLTQGWTQYTTSEFINNLNPKYKYDFEIGYKLSGFSRPLGSNNLALINNENKIIDKIFLNNKLDFEFKNLLIHKGDSVKLSFVKPNKALAKPENMYFDSIINNKEVLKANVFTSNYSIPFIINENINEVDFAFYDNNVTELDQVNVSGKIKSEAYHKKKKLVDKYWKTTFDIGKYMPLPVRDSYKNEYLLTYLEKEEGVRLVNWKGLEWYLAVGVTGEAVLFIDGEKLDSGDLNSLRLEMKDVEAVMMQPIKMNRKYQIFTTENYKKGIEELYVNYVFEYGFNAPKKYYTPIYDFNSKNKSQEIDWKPILKTNTIGEVSFKVKNSFSGYVFYIQGFTRNGKLINQIIIVE